MLRFAIRHSCLFRDLSATLTDAKWPLTYAVSQGFNEAFIHLWSDASQQNAEQAIRKGRTRTCWCWFIVVLCLAQMPMRACAQDSGRLLATSGVSQVEGAGGGGLVPWAMITGYGTRDAVGANAHYTLAYLPDFTLHSAGVAVGLYDRLELSYDHQWFDTRDAGGRLGLGDGYQFHLDIVGAKLRLLGDVVTDQDSWLPEISVGAQFKAADRHAVLQAIGARSPDGVDFYVSATKLFLAQSLLVDATLRATKANQFGLLGFGGDRDDSYSLEGEAPWRCCSPVTLPLAVNFAPSPIISASPARTLLLTCSPPTSSASPCICNA